VLAVGWFGVNAGSTLSGTISALHGGGEHPMLAYVAAPIATMFTLWAMGLKNDPTMLCNGCWTDCRDNRAGAFVDLICGL